MIAAGGGTTMRLLVALALACALGGCATVTRGTTEQIQFDSSPSGVEVRTEIVSPCGGPCQTASSEDGATMQQPPAIPQAGPACITPCVVQVKRTDVLRATFSKEGYQPVTIPIDVRVAGAGVAGMAGNVLIGGLIGLGVDTVSGAALEHFPNPATVQLIPLPPPPAIQPATPRRPQPRAPRAAPTS